MGRTEIFLILVMVGLHLGSGQLRPEYEEERIESSQKPNLTLNIEQPKKSPGRYFHKLAPNTILINHTGILTLRLDCWAPYPINLQFYGHLTNHEVSVKTFRKQHGSQEHPISLFFINATMDADEHITGNYTCTSVQNPSKQSSYYIFVSPKLPGVILTRRKHIFIQPTPLQKQVTFPCAVSNPDVHVNLFKDDVVVPLSEKLTYDAKKGFKMTLDLLDESVFGDYSCRTELQYDQVNITLKRPSDFEAKPILKNVRLSQKEHLNISCNAVDDFVMVYKPDSLPIISNQVQRSDEPNLYYKFRGALVSRPLAENESGYVSCNWKKSNRSFVEWTVASSGNRKKKPGELDLSGVQSVCSDKAALRECSNPVECRMSSCHQNEASCDSNNAISLQSGLIQCPSEGSSHYAIYFTAFPSSRGNKTIRYVDWKHASDEELLHLEELADKLHITKKHVETTFSCQGSNFVFSSGFNWVIHLENKTQLLVTENLVTESLNATVKQMWKNTKSNLESQLILSSEKSGVNVLYIECKAPVWDSWKWISRPLNLSLEAAFRNEDLNSKNISGKLGSSPHTLFLIIFVTFRGAW